MRRFRLCGLGWLAAIISLWSIGACGGHPPAGQSPFVARVILSPAGNSSIQVGSFINFIASATNAAGSNVNTPFTFSSSDTSILNIAPNGAGCAGRWDATFANCIPGGTGVVTVTASAQNASSPPTYVFVHPPIDNIVVKGVLLDNLPIQEPCLSQGQTMTVEAHAYSQGADITSSVGPFNFSANNSSVVSFTPIVNTAYNFATNQATAKAVNPGLTFIYASASGVTSNSFQQPNLVPSPPVTFDFFETCPIQNIALELGFAGSGQTSFAISKSTPGETVVATLTDVMGNTSLPNSTNGIVLSKIPLTWTSSQAAVVGASTSCLQSCGVTLQSPGAASVTASCTPPTCNIGFPVVPPALSPASLPACALYVHSFLPQVTSCEPFIPLPVYASPLPSHSTAAISGLVTGATSPSIVLATSLDCAAEPPADCSTGIYAFSTARAAAGTATGMPTAPNSLLPTPTGDKFYVGSDFGAQILNPTNLGTQTSAFIQLGTVTGRVLAVSPNGSLAIFSDEVHTPNQVYVVNGTNAAAPSITALDIWQGSAAAFSRDGLKAFIFGFDISGNPNLYVYSTIQALQVIPLPPQTSVKSIVFSTNGAFVYVAERSLGGGSPAVSVFNTCDNQPYTDTVTGLHEIPLSAPPISFKALPDGVHFVALENNGTLEYITASITGIPVATPTLAATSLCPMSVGHTPPQKINLGQGTIQPIDFFISADGTVVYVPTRDRSSILVYNFSTGAVSGIQLLGPTNPSPLSADMTIDSSTLMIAGSDGMVHQISTSGGGIDQFQFGFPNLANFLNPFCTSNPDGTVCTFDYIGAKP
jgi:hypothetical protein